MPYKSTPLAVYADLDYVPMDELEEYMNTAGRGDDYTVVHVPDDVMAEGDREVYRYLCVAVYGKPEEELTSVRINWIF